MTERTRVSKEPRGFVRLQVARTCSHKPGKWCARKKTREKVFCNQRNVASRQRFVQALGVG